MKPEVYKYYLQNVGLLLIVIIILAKAIYKVLGYGTPTTAFEHVMYLLTAIAIAVTIPYFVYIKFIKKKNQGNI